MDVLVSEYESVFPEDGCIGNSITYGAFIANRDQNSYPAQLQAYLGDGYEVRNYGVSGRTLLTQGDYPYVKNERVH